MLINEIYRVLKPGGVFFFAENIKGNVLHHYFRKWFSEISHYWFYPTLKDMKKMLRRFDRVEMRTNGVLALFGPTESLRKLLALVDLLFAFIPSRWNYMCYGYAKK